MDHLDVQYVGSYISENQCPPSKLPEYAFIGRSNVGKSSLINMLCQRKNLARVSNTPGKTQLLNYFDVNQQWYLVDLPGYGYAKVSKKQRAKFEKMIERFLSVREALQCTFVLLDSRHSLQKIDHEFINWMGANGIPFVIVFTKTDKLKDEELETNINEINQTLLTQWSELPTQFISSAKTKKGRDEILAFIDDINRSIAD